MLHASLLGSRSNSSANIATTNYTSAELVECAIAAPLLTALPSQRALKRAAPILSQLIFAIRG